MTNILYISALSSKALIDKLHKQSGKDPGFAVQKFNRLLVGGIKNNGANITVLSAPPVGKHNSKKLFWFSSIESEDGINYRYLPFINLSGLRQLFLVASTFFKTLSWAFTHKKSKSAVVCDVLNAGLCTSAILACKVTGTPIVGVMTDMPGLMVRFGNDQKMPFRTRMATKLIKWGLDNYDKYVFLTEAMNTVNAHNRPYIVMEGMSDSDMVARRKVLKKTGERIVMYAGGLHERYGLKKLTEAFMSVPGESLRLHLYGMGPFVEELQTNYCQKDSRIMYMGVAPNAEVVNAELSATLLVNPRPTDEEFTKYSFPSKNIEYMASGTPLLTTKLPGMPAEYYPNVFLIEDESVEGYAKALSAALSHTDEQLFAFGSKAKCFVIENKNSYEQAKRILQLIQL